MQRVGLIALFACAFFEASARAEVATTPPAPTRFVTDGAGLLSAQTTAELDAALAQHERKTGQQIVVWIGTSLHGDSIEEWAARTFSAWGIGDEKRDDGAALFVFAEDRKARIEVGYGLEPVLTDALSGRILDEHLIPKMRANDPNGAIADTVRAMLITVGGSADVAAPPPPPRAEEPPQRAPFGGGILRIVFMVIFVLVLMRNPWLALFTMSNIGGRRRGGFGGGFGGGGGGGFFGGGGSSGGGGASRGW